MLVDCLQNGGEDRKLCNCSVRMVSWMVRMQHTSYIAELVCDMGRLAIASCMLELARTHPVLTDDLGRSINPPCPNPRPLIPRPGHPVHQYEASMDWLPFVDL